MWIVSIEPSWVIFTHNVSLKNCLNVMSNYTWTVKAKIDGVINPQSNNFQYF